MGLAARVIPTLLARGDVLVKGNRFDSWRSVGHVLQAARVHAARGVDELIVLDIAATPEGRGPNLALVEKLCEPAFTPITVGGGVRSVEDVRDLLKAGADKVAIGTAAFETDILRESSDKFGRQAIVASIDYLFNGAEVFSHCGRVDKYRSAHIWAKECEARGAGEILLTCIDREGTMTGYDLEVTREIARLVSVPVIAHGGCGSYQNMREALDAGASAVASGAMFQFTDNTPKGAAQYLAKHGMEVRL